MNDTGNEMEYLIVVFLQEPLVGMLIAFESIMNELRVFLPGVETLLRHR